MRYRLRRLPGVTQTEIERLIAEGIEDADGLLTRAAYPAQRATLARRSGITKERLLHLAAFADLLRVKGVGPKIAQLLVLAGGVKSTRELASQNPEVLHAAIEGTIDCAGILRRTPTIGQLSNITEVAGELIPRLVMGAVHETQVKREYSRLLKRLAEDAKRSFCTFQATYASICLAGVLLPLAYLGARIIRILQIVPMPRTDSAVSAFRLAEEAAWRSFEVIGYSLASVAILLLLVTTVVSAIVYLSHGWTERLMFRTTGSRIAFLRLEDTDSRRHRRIERLLQSALCCVAPCLFVAALWFPEESTRIIERAGPVVPPATIVVVLIVCGPSLWELVRQRQKGSTTRACDIQRFLQYRLVELARMAIILILALKVLLPLGLATYRFVGTQCILPGFRMRLEPIMSDLEALPSGSVNVAGSRSITDLFTAELVGMWSFDEGLYDVGASVLASVAVPAWRVIAVILFVLPLVLLGNPWHGVLVLVLTATSYYAEEAIVEHVPELLGLGRGSLASITLLALLILSNTVFHSWTFQGITGPSVVCYVCGSEAQAGANRCPSCGARLPSGWNRHIREVP